MWLNGRQRGRVDPGLLRASCLQWVDLIYYLIWCTRIPLIHSQIFVPAVTVRRHIKRGPYGRTYWGDTFRDRLSKHTSCGVCCGHQWWTSWGGWGKRRPSAALLAGGVENYVSRWCKERAAVDIRSPAPLWIFLFSFKEFCSDHIQPSC